MSFRPPIKIKKTPIPAAMLADMALFVMQFSELDDVLSLQLFRLAGLSQPSYGFMVINQMPIRQKVETIEALLDVVAPSYLKTFVEMRTDISKIALYRNTICHGLYSGYDASTQCYLFSFTSRGFAFGHPGQVGQEGFGIKHTDVIQFTKLTMTLVHELERDWKLKTYREQRYGPVLPVQQRGQTPRQAAKSARRKRQPRSSQA